MTEDEAKTKFCPFSRVPIMTETDGISIAGNRVPLYSGEEKFVKCLGSACMAWRVIVGVVEPKNASGHCGLAGKS